VSRSPSPTEKHNDTTIIASVICANRFIAFQYNKRIEGYQKDERVYDVPTRYRRWY